MTSRTDKIKYTIMGSLLTVLVALASCVSNNSKIAPENPETNIKNAQSIVEDSSKSLQGTTNTIRKETKSIDSATPPDLKPKIQPHTNSIFQQLNLQDNIVLQLTNAKKELSEATGKNNELTSKYNSVVDENTQLKADRDKGLREKFEGYSGWCFWGIILCITAAIFSNGNKFAIYGAITCAIGLAVCIALVSIIPYVFWIIIGLSLTATGIFVYNQFFAKKKIDQSGKVINELVKTQESAKLFMGEGNRKYFFGNGPLPGKVDHIQSETTKAVVNEIRSDPAFVKAEPVPVSKYIDLNNDGIDDNTGLPIPTDSKELLGTAAIKITAETDDSANQGKISFGGNANKTINLRAKIILH